MVGQICRFLTDMHGVGRPAGAASGDVAVRKIAGSEDETRYEVTAAGAARVISLKGGVWNPASYQPVAKGFFTTADVSPPPLTDMECAAVLLSPGLRTFMAENTRLSTFLNEHPASAAAHVQAALLVGTIALNDHSGEFMDLRIPLNRMTAHLAAADALGVAVSDAGRRLAECIRLTLCGQQADALALIKELSAGGEKVAEEWATILRLRNTCDWRTDRERALGGGDGLKHEYFRALVRSVGAGPGLQFLRDAGVKPDAGYLRIANAQMLSVEHGHVFTKPLLGVEFQEAAAAAGAFGIKVEQGSIDWLGQYADAAEGSPLVEEAGKSVFQVAGKNLMAGYHQRHLMQGLQKLFAFLHDDWGVADEAKALEGFIGEKLPAMRYTPFLKRMIARSDEARRAANVPCETVIRDHPELATPTLWMSLRDDEDKRRVLPFPDPHGWFRPALPAGTAFGIDDRLYEIGVGDENDTAWMTALWRRAPYSYPLARYNAHHENGNSDEGLSPAIVRKWLGPMAEFNLKAMRFLAASHKGQPGLYQAEMEKAAAVAPDLYLELGEYLMERGLRDRAAAAYLQAFEKADDRVRMANESLPLVKYLYEKGDQAMATKVAEAAAEAYSYQGLAAHIWLLEQRGQWRQALETARKTDKRYNGDDGPLAETACLVRLSMADMPAARALGYEARLSGVFPAGVKKAELADFSAPPEQGVLIRGSSRQMVPFGLEDGMVIVALNGLRTDTFAQYQVVRSLADDPRISLIVWDGKGYRVSEGSLPGRRFKVDMTDYRK